VRRLVLLRHGLTPWNEERRFQGHADIELTETGHLQAKAAAGTLAGLEPTAVWSSDLLRAAQTAEYVAAATGLTLETDPRLREIHVGDFQGLTHPEVVERFGPGPWEYADHGGESEHDLAVRLCGALGEIAASLADGDTAVVVSHGHALRVAVIAFLGWPASTLDTMGALDNCGWVELTDQPATWTASAPWKLAAYNRRTPIS
jgi:glucosyl-3-phosphoglycerate phosphatase